MATIYPIKKLWSAFAHPKIPQITPPKPRSTRRILQAATIWCRRDEHKSSTRRYQLAFRYSERRCKFLIFRVCKELFIKKSCTSQKLYRYYLVAFFIFFLLSLLIPVALLSGYNPWPADQKRNQFFPGYYLIKC